MAAIRGKNTRPETAVRRLLRASGYRIQKHRKDLPGKPDIVIPDEKTVVFINGCFWHGHDGCRRAGLPSTNRAFWKKKIDGNKLRDRRQQRLLKKAGWKAMTIWTCKKTDASYLLRRLKRFGVEI
jgi:DNA mismatch endonuclease (patch repair protein)